MSDEETTTSHADELDVPSWVNSYRRTSLEQQQIPHTPEDEHRVRTAVLKALAGVAVLGTVGGVGFLAYEGLKSIDENSQKIVDSVVLEMPDGGDFISLAKKAVIELGLDEDKYNETEIGQSVTGDSTPQPGQQVTFNEVQHWYGTTVEGSTVDTDK